MALPELIHIPQHGPDSEAWVRKEAITHITATSGESGPYIYIHVADPNHVFRLEGDSAANFVRHLKTSSGEVSFG